MKDDPVFQKFLIKEYKHWKVYIHQDQGTLGRSYLWCKREDAIDFLEMTNREKDEFFEVAKALKVAVMKLFKPDLFNYASLGNETNHLHVHIIPRYAKDREFAGTIFQDPRWGHSYRTREDFTITEEKLYKIRDAIQEYI